MRTSLLALLVFGFAACDNSEPDPEPTDTTPPTLVSATSDGSSVAVTFDEAVDPTTVTAAAFTVTPDASVTSASGSGTTVTLVLAAALDDEERTYTVTANGVADLAGNAAAGTSATFTYGSGDTDPPMLVGAEPSSDGSSVVVSFNEAVDPVTVSAAAFTIAPGVAVASASGSGTNATLVLAAELDDDDEQTYTVTANGVADATGNVANGTSATFTFGGGGGSSGGSSVGAAYPNAGDSRLIFLNTAGDRFLVFNPVTGAVTDADDLDDIENGLIPLDAVGAAASVFGEDETYFFSTDGDTFTNYERDVADFDMPASFEEEYDEMGYDLNSIGAAVEGNFFASNSIVLFNQNGTEWQLWQPEEDSFSDVLTFPSQFGNGQAPIPAVGAAVYREDTNQVYLFNREGTLYTIWNGNSFTAAFDVEELGDIEF